MNRLNRYILIVTGILLLSCGGDTDHDSEEVQEESLYGGVFKMPVGSYFSCIRPVEIQKLETAQIYDQIVESLVKYNPKTLEIESAIASSWEISEDGLTYSFDVRDDVYFHDNECFDGGKGRKLELSDLIYTFETIYTQSSENRAYYTFKNTIVGGEDFYNGTSNTISGITNEGNILKIEISEPSTVFLQKMATIYTCIIPKEALEMENFVPVGTGPFVYEASSSSSELITLSRNDNYYMKDEEGNQLPYLDSVVFEYYEHSEDQMDLFWDGGMTYIPGVPITSISEVLEE